MHLHPTGNEYVSLADLRHEDGSLHAVNLLSSRHKGLLQFVGTGKAEKPFLAPVVLVKGCPVVFDRLEWRQDMGWLPVCTMHSADVTATVHWIAAPGHKGFSVVIELAPSADASGLPRDCVCCLRGCWGGVEAHVQHARRLAGRRTVRAAEAGRGLLGELTQDSPVAAFCVACYESSPGVLAASLADPGRTARELEACGLPAPGGAVEADDGTPVHFAVGAAPVPVGGAMRAVFHVAFGLDDASAAAGAAHLGRMGAERLLQETAHRLEQLTLRANDTLVMDAINRNALYCHFYTTGRTYDTEQFCCVASRAPGCAAGAAYSDRDALLWSFPCILQQSPAVAREILHHAFTTQLRNTGVRSRHIDGTVLEPGLELDQLCAPVIALTHYVRFTNDFDFAAEKSIREAIAHLRSEILKLRFENNYLFRTFLDSSHAVPPYPALTFHSVMAWKFFFDLAFLEERLDPDGERSVANRVMALRVRRSIYTHCVTKVREAIVFAYCVPVAGEGVQYDPLAPNNAMQDRIAEGPYDDPLGSLVLLPYWGFCRYFDPLYVNTVRLVLSAQSDFSHHAAKFAFPGGCRDGAILGPSVAGMANQLVARINQQKIRQLLPDLAMDHGLACGNIDPQTGEAQSGHGMAAMAGYWAYALYRGLAKVSSYGWPEPTDDEIRKTEGALRITSILTGGPYPQRQGHGEGSMAESPSYRQGRGAQRPGARRHGPAPAGYSGRQLQPAPGETPSDDIGNRKTPQPKRRPAYAEGLPQADDGDEY